ncbi:MAG: glycoside hydrolase family 78 protein [Muribaculaceae bacterium]|nr:glycoside hydrolase family 78 protein [Muribaculaceae bacterium]
MKRYILSVLGLGGVLAAGALEVTGLKCESLVDPLAIDNTQPRFSWQCNAGVRRGEDQTAYQILVASDKALLDEKNADLWNSGKVMSPILPSVTYAGKELRPKDFSYWKVRVWNKDGKVSDWSPAATFGIGLLDEGDWKGVFIGRGDVADKDNSPFFRKSFEWNGGDDKVLLHVNSLGYHEVYVNGCPAGDAVLSPAVAQFSKRSQIVTYDIAPLLRRGGNDIVLWLGRGWFHDSFPGGVSGGPFVRAQMETLSGGQWKTVLATDSTWSWADSGYSSFGSWWPHQFGGETVDCRKTVSAADVSAIVKWHNATEAAIPSHKATPQMAEPNRCTRSFHPVSKISDGDSAWIYDLGTNFTGWTEIDFKGLPEGRKVRISYCDFMNEDGKFRDGLYEDYLIASGRGHDRFVNKFNYKAYRYLKLSGLSEAPQLSGITAKLIHTDYSGEASFECSDPDLNAIHNMMSYTMRCLTLGGYMVDCPQVERLGYGGDGNASTPFVQTIFNMAPTYMNWMQAWADCMREGGSMPNTAPNPYTAGGGPYWCGFIITASWQTYLNYGDTRLLERYYPYMTEWLGYVEKHSVDGLLEPWPETEYRGWFLGDWATPAGIDQTDPRSVGLVTNCYIKVCYQTMAKIASLLGKETEARRWQAEADKLVELLHNKYYDKAAHSYATGTQIDLIYPMLAGVTPRDCIDDVELTLETVTAGRYRGHLATGLMGLPIITEWAILNRKADFVYGMLKKREYPGFLYMLDNGATTTWEHWNGERSHIHNCYNSIGVWFYQALAGIRPDETGAGYKRVCISPQTVDGIDWVKAAKDTPFGRIAVEWTDKDREFSLKLDIPVGCETSLQLPFKPSVLTVNGKKHEYAETIKMPSGRHTIVCRR